jgi:magnesium transporter
MAAFIRRRTKPGASPGTIVADPESPQPVIRVIAYGPDSVEERQIHDVSKLAAYLAKWPVTWVNVDGLGSAEVVQKVAQHFKLHRLAVEDVVNVHQRAKVEEYSDHLFIVARMVTLSERLSSEQISIFLGSNFVLTFQEREGDCLEPVRNRIREKRGRIRDVGPDYLAYAILDAVIDSYFPVLEEYGERLDRMDEQLALHPTRDIVTQIHATRSELLFLRRAVWPHREALATLTRDQHALIDRETRIYLRDCYDHTIQIFDLLETDRELCADMRDLYLSEISNRMTEVMKVLTLIATIFIPLGFIASVYGMNFDTSVSPWNMPELHWEYGYPYSLVLMAAVAATFLIFFWRRGWLKR